MRIISVYNNFQSLVRVAEVGTQFFFISILLFYFFTWEDYISLCSEYEKEGRFSFYLHKIHLVPQDILPPEPQLNSISKSSSARGELNSSWVSLIIYTGESPWNSEALCPAGETNLISANDVPASLSYQVWAFYTCAHNYICTLRVQWSQTTQHSGLNYTVRLPGIIWPLHPV